MSARGARCASCEKRLRAGSIKRAIDSTDKGLSWVLVCTECFRKTLPLLIPKPASVAPLCSLCRRDSASVCAGCVEKLGEHVRELTATNVVLKQTKAAEPALCGRDAMCTLDDGHEGECLHDWWVCDCGACDNFRRAEESHEGGPVP